MREKIRSKVVKYPVIFKIIHFIYSPIRIIRQKRLCSELGKKKISEIQYAYKNEQAHIWYCGVPVHNNMGDQAQRLCIEKWIKINFNNYQCFEFTTQELYDDGLIKFLDDIVKENDLFVFQSGYCTQETHLDHGMHKKIIKHFPNNKIVFFPQTVKFHKKVALKKAKKVFEKHNDILFLARDKVSYQTMIDNFENIDIRCYPDIVTSLIGSFEVEQVKRSGAFICVRNDSEKFYSDEQINTLKEELEKKYAFVDIGDTNSSSEDGLDGNYEKELYQIIKKFASYELIITDRYHGTIFSLIANTPVIVIKTLDHKVATGVQWFAGVISEKQVCLVDCLEEAIQKTDKMIVDYRMIDKDFFINKYYSELPKLILKD